MFVALIRVDKYFYNRLTKVKRARLVNYIPIYFLPLRECYKKQASAQSRTSHCRQEHDIPSE